MARDRITSSFNQVHHLACYILSLTINDLQMAILDFFYFSYAKVFSDPFPMVMQYFQHVFPLPAPVSWNKVCDCCQNV